MRVAGKSNFDSEWCRDMRALSQRTYNEAVKKISTLEKRGKPAGEWEKLRDSAKEQLDNPPDICR